jgi:hypothetical protein
MYAGRGICFKNCGIWRGGPVEIIGQLFPVITAFLGEDFNFELWKRTFTALFEA